MKKRFGFVSNSSSSSFIVAVNKGRTKIKLEVEVDLERYSHSTISTIEDLMSYFIDYGYDLDEIKEDERYQEAKKAIEEGKEILTGSFSSDEGDPIESLLCYNGLKKYIDSKNIVIIQSEGGY